MSRTHLNETISGLVAGNGTGIASELHGASVSGGGLVDVDGVGETGDFGGRVLAEGDGVGEGLVDVDGVGETGDFGGRVLAEGDGVGEGLVDVDGVGETGDFGGRVLAEGDGVGEGLVSGGGHQGDTGGGVGDIHGGHGGAHLGSELSGDTDGLQETIVVFVFGEDEFAVHGDWLWLSGGWLGRRI